jgi:hypothetical protein
LNPRPLGYEPYDVRLWRPGPSLAGAVTSADRTDPISLRRLRLPCLELSRRVRFTNRFTEQAIDLRFPAPSRHPGGCRPRAAAVTPRPAKQPRDLPDPDTAGGRMLPQREGAAGLRSDSAASRPRPSESAGNRGPEVGAVGDPLLRRRSDRYVRHSA